MVKYPLKVNMSPTCWCGVILVSVSSHTARTYHTPVKAAPAVEAAVDILGLKDDVTHCIIQCIKLAN